MNLGWQQFRTKSAVKVPYSDSTKKGGRKDRYADEIHDIDGHAARNQGVPALVLVAQRRIEYGLWSETRHERGQACTLHGGEASVLVPRLAPKPSPICVQIIQLIK